MYGVLVAQEPISPKPSSSLTHIRHSNAGIGLLRFEAYLSLEHHYHATTVVTGEYGRKAHDNVGGHGSRSSGALAGIPCNIGLLPGGKKKFASKRSPANAYISAIGQTCLCPMAVSEQENGISPRPQTETLKMRYRQCLSIQCQCQKARHSTR